MYIFSLLFFTNNSPDFMKTIEIDMSSGDNNCKMFIEEAKHLKLQAEGGAFCKPNRVHIFGFSHSIFMFF